MNRATLAVLLLCLATFPGHRASAAGAVSLDAAIAARVAVGDFPIEVLVDFEAAGAEVVHRRLPAARRSRAEYSAELRLLAESVGAARRGIEESVSQRAMGRMRIKRGYDHLPRALVVIEDEAGLAALLATPGVTQVLPDLQLEPHLPESLLLVQQPTAASSGADGRGTSIVVMDSGVTYTHSDFGSCTAPGTPASCRVVVSLDIAANDGLLDSATNPHGTNVSAIVARTAPGARLIVLDVFGASGASSSDVTAAYDWVIANAALHNIEAVNLSLGVPGFYARSACGNSFTAYDAGGNNLGRITNPFRAPIDSATAIGVATITSSGNDAVKNGLPMPACTANAISVGAVYDANVGSRTWTACTDSTTAADRVTCFSNSASFLSVLAPGAMITAGGWQYAGTSQAAPHVAGAWAVLASEYPGESIAQLRTRLINGGTAVTDAANGITKPRIDFAVMFPPPANDDFSAATTLTGSSAAASTSNRFADKQSGEPSHAGNAGGKSVWWNWTAPASGTLAVHTAGSAIDTLLAVYSGGAVNGLATVASNDNAPSLVTSALTAPVTSGTTYRIAVDGKDGAWGAVTLSLAFTAASADLSAALAAAAGPIATGSVLNYGLTVTNGGPSAATGVTATLALPAGVVAGTPPTGCTAGGTSVTCSTASLASGSSASWTVPATATVPGTSQASLVVGSTTADPNSGNNSATVQTTVVDPANLALSLVPPGPQILQGTTAAFTLELVNSGPAAASGVLLTVQTTGLGAPQQLPAGCSGGIGSVSCSLGTLVATGRVQRNLSFAAASAGAISLHASASSSTPEGSPGDESVTWNGSVTAVADLSVSLSSTTTSLRPGDPVVVGVLVGNNGPSTAQSVQLALALPAGITLAVADSACSGTPVVICSLGNVPAAGSATANLTLDTSAAGPGSALFSAEVTGSGAVDPNPANDADSLLLEVLASNNARQVPALPDWLLYLAVLILGLAGVRAAACLRRR